MTVVLFALSQRGQADSRPEMTSDLIDPATSLQDGWTKNDECQLLFNQWKRVNDLRDATRKH